MTTAHELRWRRILRERRRDAARYSEALAGGRAMRAAAMAGPDEIATMSAGWRDTLRPADLSERTCNGHRPGEPCR